MGSLGVPRNTTLVWEPSFAWVPRNPQERKMPKDCFRIPGTPDEGHSKHRISRKPRWFLGIVARDALPPRSSTISWALGCQRLGFRDSHAELNSPRISWTPRKHRFLSFLPFPGILGYLVFLVIVGLLRFLGPWSPRVSIALRCL